MSKMRLQEQKEANKEAQILHQFNHPNIVKFKEIYINESSDLCIVMEYADGKPFFFHKFS